MYRRFKHKYGNRGEKSTQNGTFWSKGKRDHIDRAIVDRSRHSSRSIGRSCNDEPKKGRGLADRSRLISRSIGRSLKNRKEKGRRTADRSRLIDRSIGPNTRTQPEIAPIDRVVRADRSGANDTWACISADRSRFSSRSIGESSSRRTPSFFRLL